MRPRPSNQRERHKEDRAKSGCGGRKESCHTDATRMPREATKRCHTSATGSVDDSATPGREGEEHAIAKHGATIAKNSQLWSMWCTAIANYAVNLAKHGATVARHGAIIAKYGESS